MKGKRLQIGMIVLSLAIVAGGYAVWRHFNPVPCHKDVDCAWNAFQRIAFGNEYDPTISEEIVKWDRPIYIAVQTDKEDVHVPQVEAYINLVQPHVSYPIYLLNTQPEHHSNGFNTLILFSDDFEHDIYHRYKQDLYELFGNTNDFFDFYESLKGENVLCAGYTVSSLQGVMGLSTIVIPSTHDKKTLVGCIHEEITQGLGLINDYYGFTETSFNDLEGYHHLMVLDILLLRILYHPDIKPGMSIEEVGKIFPTIFNEVKEFSASTCCVDNTLRTRLGYGHTLFFKHLVWVNKEAVTSLQRESAAAGWFNTAERYMT